MSVDRDLVISWKGEERAFTPAFRFLRRVDAKLQSDPDRKGNLFTVALTVINGGSAIMDVPVVMSEFLREAGFSVSEEECWHVLSAITSGHATGQQREDYANFAMILQSALVPDVSFGKNPDAPASEKPKSRGATKSQKSTGQAAI
jgi:hypothetical protein